MADLKSRIYPHILNARGWRTKRKIVVLESDDWGSIRTSSKEAYNMLLNAGTRVDKCPYCKNDSLASQDDLQLLFEVLAKHKDSKGKPALITANTIVANPDFDKIKEQRFETYFYEPFTETLKKYPNHEKSFQLWKEGISSNLFFPQFHGREHLNVHRWLQALRSGSKETLLAFENKMFGISTTITVEKRRSYMAALEYDDQKQMEWQKEMLVDGLDLFEKIFHYRSKSFIATNYTWYPEVESTLAQHGIRYLQGSWVQTQPTNNGIQYNRHILGHKTSSGHWYLIRNCFFEPSLDPSKDWVSECLKEISTAFLWNKPAIISVHRVNFIGHLNSQNRDNNLKRFDHLLSQIVKRWPHVEFKNSVELGDLIASQK